MVYSVKSNDLQSKDILLSENESQTENIENETFSSNISLKESALINECGKTINGTKLHPVHVQKSVKISRAEDGRSVISFVVSRLGFVEILRNSRKIACMDTKMNTLFSFLDT